MFNSNYKKISHAERISIIYTHLVHMHPLRHISRAKGVSFNSVRNIIEAYQVTGRTNKKNYKTVKLQNYTASSLERSALSSTARHPQLPSTMQKAKISRPGRKPKRRGKKALPTTANAVGEKEDSAASSSPPSRSLLHCDLGGHN